MDNSKDLKSWILWKLENEPQVRERLADFMASVISDGGLCEFMTSIIKGEGGNLNILEELQHEDSLEDKVRKLLLNLGYSSSLDGYNYLMYAMTTLEFGEETIWVTKLVYPEIAKHFGTKRANIEKSIRAATTKAWQQSQNNPERKQYQDKLFPDGRPSNKELFTKLREVLKSKI